MLSEELKPMEIPVPAHRRMLLKSREGKLERKLYPGVRDRTGPLHTTHISDPPALPKQLISHSLPSVASDGDAAKSSPGLPHSGIPS